MGKQKFGFFRDRDGDLSVPKIAIFSVIGVIILIFALSFLFSTFVFVTAGHTGVVLNWGAVSDLTLSEGIHICNPISQKVIQIDNRIQKLEVESASASKDLQTVHGKIALNYRVNNNLSASLYKNVGLDYTNTIVSPAIQESMKATTAKYTAEELITKRGDVSDHVKTLLAEKIAKYGLEVTAFNIVNFDFSKEFNSAIESKQTAQQLALKAEQDLARVKIEAEQKIAQAKAEAESLKVQKQEITQDLLKLREIEAKIKAVEKWNGQMPTYVGGDGNIFNIPITAPK